MRECVTFFVPGVPVSQGSMTSFVVGRRQADGSVLNARAVTTAANKGRLNEWRRTVQDAAAVVFTATPSEEPAAVGLCFVMPRPRTVSRAWPGVRPDIDKLARAVLDALTGVAYRDDACVVMLMASKVYGDGDACGVTVVVADPTDASMEGLR